jgi:cellulose 1,4-beta-cellobiosidase
MDIWEANYNAAAYTPHPCSLAGRCSGTDCGDGDNRYKGACDKDGCDFNSWRMGDQTFLGKGKTVDTSKKFTIVTQFITSGNTASGALTEIRRIYVQNGKVIANSQSKVSGVWVHRLQLPSLDDPCSTHFHSSTGNSITDSFCAAQKSKFGDQNYFATKGGLNAMGQALDRGMVLSLSLWDDYTASMLWLDSSYPLNKDASLPGTATNN